MYIVTVTVYLLFIISKALTADVDGGVFTISTAGCTIRGYPLVTAEVEKHVHRPRNMRKCSRNNRLVTSNHSHIWVIRDALDLFNVRYEQEFFCCYRNFTSENYLENIVYGNCVQFSGMVRANHTFVRVECFYIDTKIYDDFFLFPEIADYTTKTVYDGFNVLILGIESMSRLNFQRTMNKTAEFLRKKGSIELLGYNKLGDNSLPNLFPLLFGRSFEYIRETCFKNARGKCPLIWETFKKAGYYTSLGSDSVAAFLGEYEYNMTTPTDFYLQPFMFEARNLFKNPHYGYHQCLVSRYFYEILLEYIRDLTNNLREVRTFGIFWEESISHEDLNEPFVMDEDYVSLLRDLERTAYLNQTVLILLSDHGMRWGDFVLTEQGRLEERLPLVQLLVPDSFKQRYREAYKNLEENRHRLTTPYDIHETLKDLANPLNLEDQKIKERALGLNNIQKSSLFLPIPYERTCKSVGIKDHWCTCYKGKKLKVTNIIRSRAAEYLIGYINELIKPYSRCQKLSVNKILQVTMVKSKEGRTYTVVVESAPGGGIFDGTLFNVQDSWRVSGTISRLNLYRNQTCIKDTNIKMYCFCKMND